MSSAVAGSDLKVSLTCPQCGAHGWVKWPELSYGLQCPKCRCKFLLNRSGKLQSLADLPHVSYTCPRCRQSASLPATLAVRAAECTTCKLPLVRSSELGHEGNAEAAQTQQAGPAENKRASYRPGWERLYWTEDGRMRKISLVLTGLFSLALLWAGTSALGLFDNSPEACARAFTYTCLAGEPRRTAAFVPDDPVQRVEFDRWRMRYFPSILDQHRPSGDSVRIGVEPIRQSPETCVLRVTMASPFLGKRAHEQTWQKIGGQWRFDPVATLRAHDQAP